MFMEGATPDKIVLIGLFCVCVILCHNTWDKKTKIFILIRNFMQKEGAPECVGNAAAEFRNVKLQV